ncbi:MAG: hypothetical protein LBF02_02335 [Mycoplasmataceae bacterium]|nr:hypothetical protein [Mycoplasmataceae bacterium]
MFINSFFFSEQEDTLSFSPFAVYSDLSLTIIGVFVNIFLCYTLIKNSFKTKDSESYSLLWVCFDVVVDTLHYTQYSGNIGSVIEKWGSYKEVSPYVALIAQILGFVYSLFDIIGTSSILYFVFKKRKKLKMFLYFLIVFISSQLLAIPFFIGGVVSDIWWFIIPVIISLGLVLGILGQDIKSFLTKDTFSLSFKYLIGLFFLNIFWFCEDTAQLFTIGEKGLIANCVSDIIVIFLGLFLIFLKLQEIKCTIPYILKHNDTKKISALDFILKNIKTLQKDDILYIVNIKSRISKNLNFFIETKKNEKFQVKLKKLKRNELAQKSKIFKILKDNNLLFFDKETGSYIKKWTYGHELLKWEAGSTKTLKKVAAEIEKFHHPPNLVNGVKRFEGFDIRESNFENFDEKIIIAYKNLIKRYRKLANVFSHQSLWRKNIIINYKRVFFLDEDDACMNNKYWDFANYIRAENLGHSEIKKFVRYANLYESTLIDMCYINAVWFYNYLIEEFDSCQKNRNLLFKTKKIIHRYLKLVIQTELEKRIFRKIEE